VKNKTSSRQTRFVASAKTLLRYTILTAVDELVRHEGWTATTIAAVANAAGVSRQTVYNEFGSRRSIADAYVMHQLDKLLDAVITLIRDNQLQVGFAKAFELCFDMIDEPMIQTALDGERAAVIDLVRATNERATTVLADLFHEIEPSISPSDAIIFADSVVRIVVGQAMFPTLARDVAVARVVRMTMVLLNRAPQRVLPAPEEIPEIPSHRA
jgi:AcrR family transcriptional regulator